MHFTFGVGSFIVSQTLPNRTYVVYSSHRRACTFLPSQAPLMAEPFLVAQPDTDDDAAARAIDPSTLRVQWAFRIAGAVVLCVACLFMYWTSYPVPGDIFSSILIRVDDFKLFAHFLCFSSFPSQARRSSTRPSIKCASTTGMVCSSSCISSWHRLSARTYVLYMHAC